VCWQKWGTENTDWEPVSGTYSYQTDEDYYKSRVSTLLASPRLTCWWWNDMLEPSSEHYVTNMSAGATWTTKDNACGVSVLNSGIPGGVAVAAGLAPGNEWNPVGNVFPEGTNGVWYAAARYRLTGGIVGTGYQNQFVIQLDSNNTAHTGYLLAGLRNHATYWSGQYDNGGGHTTFTTAVAFDTNTHLHELFRANGVTRYLIDEVEAWNSADAYLQGHCYVRLNCQADPPAAAATVGAVDFMCMAVGGNNSRTIT
jgi:hypothetical protein